MSEWKCNTKWEIKKIIEKEWPTKSKKEKVKGECETKWEQKQKSAVKKRKTE